MQPILNLPGTAPQEDSAGLPGYQQSGNEAHFPAHDLMPPPPPGPPTSLDSAPWHQASEPQNQAPDPAGSDPNQQAPNPPLPPQKAESAPWLDYGAAG